MLETFNKILATLTLLSHVGIVIFCGLWILRSYFNKKFSWFEKIFSLIQKSSLLLAFFVTLFSVAMSLFYSEVLYLPPCSMCWYQRIFIFSQFFVFGMATYNKDKAIADYSILLSTGGAGFAVYHILLQNGMKLSAPCSIDALVSCSEKLFSYYGYITIPVMSLTAFGMLLILMGVLKDKK